jgi:hypothetical protein
VPTIDLFDGISINIFYGEHLPPHIHALYNEFEALVEIRTLALYAGSFPKRQMRKVISWLQENGTEALKTFYMFNPKLK